MTQTSTATREEFKAAMDAGATYTMKVVSRHRIKTNAIAKMEKLRATAPANVFYELITDPDAGTWAHHLYCYTVIGEPKKAEQAEEQAAILDAIRTITTYYDLPWAGMGAIRDESGLNCQTFDRVMTELVIARLVNVAPEDVQCSLTSADRHNALHIGGEHKHLAQIA